MSRSIARLTRSLALWLALAGTLPPAASAESAFDRTLALARGERLRIQLDRGDVLVRARPAGPPRDVRAEASAAGFGADGVEFALERGPDGVTAAVRVDDWVDWLRGGPRIALRLTVPDDVPLEIVNESGSVDVAGTRASVTVWTDEGPVRVADVRGAVRVEAEHSDVVVERVTGDVLVRASQGRVEARDLRGALAVDSGAGIHVFGARGSVQALSRRGAIELDRVAGSVEARTRDGSVWMRLVDAPNGSVEAEGGSIHVALPAEADGVIDARSTGGRIHVAPELRLAGQRDATAVRGVLGSGGSLLRLRALGGHILLR